MKSASLSRLVALAALMTACRGSAETALSSSAFAAAGRPAAPPPEHLNVLDLTGTAGRCFFGYQGLLLDFGDPSTDALLDPRAARRGSDDSFEIEGASWLRVRSRTLSLSFYWPAAAASAAGASPSIELRARGLGARAIIVSIDGRYVARWALDAQSVRITRARLPDGLALAPGTHMLSLRLVGGLAGGQDALADLDWVHLGAVASAEPYAAPTREEVLVDATVGGRDIRALALRAPGFVRCSGWIPADAAFETELAAEGGADADVEALLLRDRQPAVLLGTAHVHGTALDWEPWSVPIAGLEGDGGLASIELVVRQASAKARVLLGRPRIEQTPPPLSERPPVSDSALLVVMGSTSARLLAPWGGPRPAPALTELASGGTTFLSNRATSSLASAVVGSMLTGLPPDALGIEQPLDGLDKAMTMLSDACRQGGVSTAMFTANPTTGAAFGFDRGWDTFVLRDPLDKGPATGVFDDARDWISHHAKDRFFVLVHARGGHPPWDAAPSDLKAMPPPGYLGFLEPSRAAEALTKARRYPGRFKDEDRERAWALHDHAIDGQDAALGKLLAELHASGRDRSTVVIVTADIASNEGAPVPFSEPTGLDESDLATPLVIRWPGQASLAGRRVSAPTGPVDLGRTILSALGLPPPSAFGGVDLAALAQGRIGPAERPLLATRGSHFSVRWGSYVLAGTGVADLRMCDLSLDPACIADVRGTSAIALESLRRFAIDAHLLSGRASTARTPFRDPLDDRTRAALVRWGLEDELARQER